MTLAARSGYEAQDRTVDRAAVGLGSVFMHLGAEVNWHTMFHDLIDDFDTEKLATRQHEAARAAGIPDNLLHKDA